MRYSRYSRNYRNLRKLLSFWQDIKDPKAFIEFPKPREENSRSNDNDDDGREADGDDDANREEVKEELKEEKRGPVGDPEPWDGPPQNWELRATAATRLRPGWNDAWDLKVNTGCAIDDFGIGDIVECWYQGFWWKARIRRVFIRPGHIEVFFLLTKTVAGQYAPRLLRPLPL